MATAAFLIYASTRTAEHYWDGIAFARSVEEATSYPQLFQPSHLLYCSLGKLVCDGLAAGGIQVRPLAVFQWLNVICASAGVGLLGHLLRRAGSSPAATVIYACLFGLSPVWWKFATDADAYIPAIVLLLLATVVARRAANIGFVLLVALIHVLSMSLHQLALFYAPVACWLIWRAAPEPGRVFRVGLYVATAALGIGAVYAAAYQAQAPGVAFVSWITTHSPDSAFSLNVPRGAFLSLRGTMRLFVGGKVGLFEPDFAGFAGLGLILIGLIGFVWKFRKARDDRESNPAPAAPWLIWIAVYAAFLVFWLPHNTFYRLFYLAPLILALRSANWLRLEILAPLVVALLGWNWSFYIYPHILPKNNAPLAFALSSKLPWESKPAVLFTRFHPDLWTISYFQPGAQWIYCADLAPARVEEMARSLALNGKNVFLEGSLLEELEKIPAGQTWLRQRTVAVTTGLFRFSKLRAPDP